MNKSINRGLVAAVATFFLGVVGTIWYLKSSKDDDDDVELCDQSAFDGSQRVETVKTVETVEDKLEEVNTDQTHINEEMRTSQEWYRNDDKVNIKDADGWRDNENPEKFWKEIPISKEDYIIRRNLSTLSFNSNGDKSEPF